MNGFQRLAVVAAVASVSSLATLGWAFFNHQNGEREYSRIMAVPAAAPPTGIESRAELAAREIQDQMIIYETDVIIAKTTFYLNMQKWVLWGHLLAAALLVAGWVVMGFRKPLAGPEV